MKQLLANIAAILARGVSLSRLPNYSNMEEDAGTQTDPESTSTSTSDSQTEGDSDSIFSRTVEAEEAWYTFSTNQIIRPWTAHEPIIANYMRDLECQANTENLIGLERVGG